MKKSLLLLAILTSLSTLSARAQTADESQTVLTCADAREGLSDGKYSLILRSGGLSGKLLATLSQGNVSRGIFSVTRGDYSDSAMFIGKNGNFTLFVSKVERSFVRDEQSGNFLGDGSYVSHLVAQIESTDSIPTQKREIKLDMKCRFPEPAADATSLISKYWGDGGLTANPFSFAVRVFENGVVTYSSKRYDEEMNANSVVLWKSQLARGTLRDVAECSRKLSALTFVPATPRCFDAPTTNYLVGKEKRFATKTCNVDQYAKDKCAKKMADLLDQLNEKARREANVD
jgi:hypothetical protein